jgi:hypothetical protein
MSFLAAAVAGTAVVGGIVARNATNKSINASEAAGERASEQLNQSTAKAREDLFKLFPAAQQNTQQGYQGALDVFKQTLPQQAGVFQAGNVAAQNQLLAGMPQFQNAILGAPVDYRQFQATQLQQPNMNFANQQLQSVDPFAPQTPQQQFEANRVPFNQQALDNIGGNVVGQNMNNGQPTNRAFNYNDLLTRGIR